MPSHPDRVRSAPLHKGYQFGDAAHRELMDGGAIVARTYMVGDVIVFQIPSRAIALGDRITLDELTRKHHSITVNVIEGEHFPSDKERHPVIEGAES